jgi:lipopolysaccharide/colanic/teichoic acid biosynthesis glycosyltransferase
MSESLPLIADGGTPLPWWKRSFDLLLSCVVLIPALPVLAVAAALVKLTSCGPAVYTQVRVGRNGRPFVLYKLRSMTHNCEATSGIVWSTKADARVTCVGRILRKTHIDELPQLFNILCGEMSLVGPRPERPELVTELEPHLSGYRDRLDANPGLTGLAQVQLPPDSDLESVRRKLALDRLYVHRQSLWLDLRLVVATAVGVLGVPFRFCQVMLAVPIEAEANANATQRSAEQPALPSLKPQQA